MAIQHDITNFPFHSKDRAIWYFITSWTTKETIPFYEANKDNLFLFLHECLAKGTQSDYTMFGVWTGEWKTDIFEMPLQQAYDKLYEHFGKK